MTAFKISESLVSCIYVYVIWRFCEIIYSKGKGARDLDLDLCYEVSERGLLNVDNH